MKRYRKMSAEEAKAWRRIEKDVERQKLGLERLRSNRSIQKELSRNRASAAKADEAFRKKIATLSSPNEIIVTSTDGGPSAQNDKAADFGPEWLPKK